MIKFGIVENVLGNGTLQIRDFDDDELYEIKGSTLSVDDINEKLKEVDGNFFFVEYDDETMEMVV